MTVQTIGAALLALACCSQVLLLELGRDDDESVETALRDALLDEPLGDHGAALAAWVALATVLLGLEKEFD